MFQQSCPNVGLKVLLMYPNVFFPIELCPLTSSSHSPMLRTSPKKTGMKLMTSLFRGNY